MPTRREIHAARQVRDQERHQLAMSPRLEDGEPEADDTYTEADIAPAQGPTPTTPKLVQIGPLDI